MSRSVLGVDIGGSAVKAGVFEERPAVETLQRLTRREIVSQTVDELRNAVWDVVTSALGRAPELRVVGVSTAGLVDPRGIVVLGSVFAGYKRFSWADEMQKRFPGQFESVIVVNDGQAATWGAFHADGLGKGTHVHAVVGTGVGGGIVIDGQLLYGARAMAGHIGHIKVSGGEGLRCVCGATGCVELLASAPAIVRRAEVLSGTEGLTFADVGAAFDAGTDWAACAVADAGASLGHALADVMNTIDPTQITLGGGVLEAFVTAQGNAYLDAARGTARQDAIPAIGEAVEIQISSLGNDAGIIGAATLASERSA